MKGRLKVLVLSRSVLLLACSLGFSGLIFSKPVFAQRINPKIAADEVYRQLPDLPQETQHIRKKGNKPATNSSLASRLIEYHTLVKGRSPLYRFDWKITLADYLGIHENIREETYPGHAYLKASALDSDRKLIQQLTRQQRLALTQTLSDIYASQARQQEAATPSETSKPPPSPANNVPEPKPSEPAKPAEPARPKLTPLPGSGGADLLRGPAPQSIPSPGTPPQSTTPPPPNQQPPEDTQKLSF